MLYPPPPPKQPKGPATMHTNSLPVRRIEAQVYLAYPWRSSSAMHVDIILRREHWTLVFEGERWGRGRGATHTTHSVQNIQFYPAKKYVTTRYIHPYNSLWLTSRGTGFLFASLDTQFQGSCVWEQARPREVQVILYVYQKLVLSTTDSHRYLCSRSCRLAAWLAYRYVACGDFINEAPRILKKSAFHIHLSPQLLVTPNGNSVDWLIDWLIDLIQEQAKIHDVVFYITTI